MHMQEYNSMKNKTLERNKDINKLLIVLLFSFLIIGITGCGDNNTTGQTVKVTENIEECKNVQVPYTIQEPYTTTECKDIKIPYETIEQKTKILLDLDDITINPKDRYVQSIHIQTGRDVVLTFSADDPLNIWVAYSEEWNKLIENNYRYTFENPLVKKLNTKSTTASFHTSAEDDYYLDIKNNHLIQKVTVYNVKMVAKWQETVKKEKIERVCNEVVEYKPVTKYRTERRCNQE